MTTLTLRDLGFVGGLSGAGISTNGLVLYLDAGDSSSYPGSGTTWTDLSGSGNNGTLVNGPTYNSSNGGYIVFDGTNDRVDCGAGLAQSGSWTVSAAVRRAGGAGVAQMIMARSNASPSFLQNYLLYFTTANKVAIQTSADSYKSASSASTISTNVWYVAAATYNSATKTLTIYINGSADGSTTLTGSPPVTETQYVQLGCVNGTSPTDFLNGNIAQALIYNRALSASEVLGNFNAIRGRFGI